MNNKLGKAAALLRRPAFAKAALRNGVAAAVEHLEVIRLTRAATLIDVGANKGQFSLAFHVLRPGARIIAFEPLPTAGDTYLKLFAGEASVELHRVAIAEEQGTAQFHITDRADSSSLLKPGDGQLRAFGVRETQSIQVDVRRMGDQIDPNTLDGPILMKIDVQGAELRVVRGCDFLERIDFIYSELSYIELYEGQALFQEFTAYLASRGFELAGVFNQVETREFGPTQADFLFKRKS